MSMRTDHRPDLNAEPLATEKHLLGRWLAQARRQGLLAAAPPEAWHTLCFLLSFTCRDGERRFTLDQLALALTLPREEAARRLEDLARTQWRGQPLAEPLRDHAGETVGAQTAAADLLLRINDAPGGSEGRPSVPPSPATGADAGYASEQLALPGEAGSEAAAPAGENASLKEALLSVGLLADQAERLLTHFPEERVRRQLAWLPLRGARKPAAFLIKAVGSDWDAPKGADDNHREAR